MDASRKAHSKDYGRSAVNCSENLELELTFIFKLPSGAY